MTRSVVVVMVDVAFGESCVRQMRQSNTKGKCVRSGWPVDMTTGSSEVKQREKLIQEPKRHPESRHLVCGM